jgi:FdhD protein
MRTPFVLSRTSPTSLAVQAAKRFGITVIGYVRGEGFNVYSHPERLLPNRVAPGDLPTT